MAMSAKPSPLKSAVEARGERRPAPSPCASLGGRAANNPAAASTIRSATTRIPDGTEERIRPRPFDVDTRTQPAWRDDSLRAARGESQTLGGLILGVGGRRLALVRITPPRHRPSTSP